MAKCGLKENGPNNFDSKLDANRDKKQDNFFILLFLFNNYKKLGVRLYKSDDARIEAGNLNIETRLTSFY